MVTDEQYRILQNRVAELENRLAAMSRELSAMRMRGDFAKIGFKPGSTETVRKDITRYKFCDSILCKRRLVLECIKKYVKDKYIKTSTEILEAFPDYIQGSLGIVKPIAEAEKYSEAHRRFFFADEDVIKMDDGVLTVCSQWDVNNIVRFINLMTDYGYKIETIERKY